jgi:hypothetical protein
MFFRSPPHCPSFAMECFNPGCQIGRLASVCWIIDSLVALREHLPIDCGRFEPVANQQLIRVGGTIDGGDNDPKNGLSLSQQVQRVFELAFVLGLLHDRQDVGHDIETTGNLLVAIERCAGKLAHPKEAIFEASGSGDDILLLRFDLRAEIRAFRHKATASHGPSCPFGLQPTTSFNQRKGAVGGLAPAGWIGDKCRVDSGLCLAQSLFWKDDWRRGRQMSVRRNCRCRCGNTLLGLDRGNPFSRHLDYRRFLCDRLLHGPGRLVRNVRDLEDGLGDPPKLGSELGILRRQLPQAINRSLQRRHEWFRVHVRLSR